MATTQLDAIRHLEDEFAAAMTRLYTVGNGLAALRQQMLFESGGTAAPHGAPSAESVSAGIPAPVATPGVTPGPTANVPTGAGLPAPPAPEAKPTGPRWWQREGVVVRLLGVVGAGILLIGVALLLAFAIQRGYFGPVARVTSAGILAVVLIGVAHWVRRDAQRAVSAVAIAAAGYATAYLDVMAATVIYEWIPPVAGLALAGIIAASGVVLARSWDSQLLALIAVGGVALLGPVIGDGRTLLTAAFLVVLAVASYPAHLGRTWLILHPVRVIPAVVAILASLERAEQPELLALAVVLAGFDLGTTVLGGTRHALLAPMVAVSAISLLATADQTAVAGWVVLASAALVYAGVGLVTRESGTLRDQVAPWAGATGTVLALAAAFDGSDGRWVNTVVIAIAVAYAAAAHAISRLWVQAAAVVLAIVALLAYAATVEPFVDKDLASSLVASDLVNSALVLGLVVLLAPVLSGLVPEEATRVAGVLPWLLWPLGLVAGCGTVVSAAVLVAARSDSVEDGFVVGHATSTLLWALGAAYLIQHGLRRNADASLALRLGLVVAGASVAKLLFFDLAALDGIVRVVAFIGAGLLLLAMGTSYAKALDRARVEPPAQATPAHKDPVS